MGNKSENDAGAAKDALFRGNKKWHLLFFSADLLCRTTTGVAKKRVQNTHCCSGSELE